MPRADAIAKISDACTTISLQMMKLTPAARGLEDEATTAAVLAAAHKLTVELEIIKKQLIRLQQRDDSAEL